MSKKEEFKKKWNDFYEETQKEENKRKNRLKKEDSKIWIISS